ncbi:MAG: hypothetical protein ACE14S_02080 [Candidatus Bathyarchaeia archaeon]
MQRQKKVILLALTLVLIATASSATILSINSGHARVAQNVNLIWEHTYGGTGDDRAFHAAAVEDGFLVVGSSTSLENNRTTAWALRLDSKGEQVWNRTFSQDAGSEFRQVLALQDGFLLVGTVFLGSDGGDGLVVRVDEDGNVAWNVTLRARDGLNKLFSASLSGDCCYLAGLTSAAGSSDSDVWLVKLDADGDILWNMTFGGPSGDAGRAVAAFEGGCVVAGYTDVTGNGDYDFLVLRVNGSSGLVWSKRFGGLQSDKAYTVATCADGFVVSGDTRSVGSGDADAWLIKVGLDGDLLWERAAGGSGFDAPTCLSAMSGGGFVVGGTTFSFGNGQRDFWLFAVADDGEVLWSGTVGRGGFEEAYAILDCGEGEFAMAGWTSSIGVGKYDFYVVKLSR